MKAGSAATAPREPLLFPDGEQPSCSEARARAEDASRSYERCVNPQWVRLLDLLGMKVRYVRCQGAELYTDDGRRILDFLSG